MTFVSILIVSYNVRQYVAHAIDAILKSDVEEMEIIVVDNNSMIIRLHTCRIDIIICTRSRSLKILIMLVLARL